MSIQHHPTDEALSAFAAGTLDLGQHVAIATHLVACAKCRSFVRTMEHVGGAMLENLPVSKISVEAFAKIEARLNESTRSQSDSQDQISVGQVDIVSEEDVPGIPRFVRHYRFGAWKWIAPSVHVRTIELPHESATRVFLLKSGPGTKMLEHSHTGLEMTCVLSGAFNQDGHRYGPGDFDLGDVGVDHQPMVEDGEDCVCLVAMQGTLQWHGWVGRLVQPFIRL